MCSKMLSTEKGSEPALGSSPCADAAASERALGSSPRADAAAPRDGGCQGCQRCAISRRRRPACAICRRRVCPTCVRYGIRGRVACKSCAEGNSDFESLGGWKPCAMCEWKLRTCASCQEQAPASVEHEYDAYWIQRWTAVVRLLLGWKAPTRRGAGRQRRRIARARSALQAAIAEFLEGAEGTEEEGRGHGGGP